MTTPSARVELYLDMSRTVTGQIRVIATLSRADEATSATSWCWETELPAHLCALITEHQPDFVFVTKDDVDHQLSDHTVRMIRERKMTAAELMAE